MVDRHCAVSRAEEGFYSSYKSGTVQPGTTLPYRLDHCLLTLLYVGRHDCSLVNLCIYFVHEPRCAMAQYDPLNSQRNTPYGGASYSYASQDHLGPTSSPYASGDPYYNESTGYITPQPAKKGISNWVKIGVPVAILLIAGAVVGGILGTRHKSTEAATGAAAASAAKKIGLFATATNSEFMMPLYPSTVGQQLSCIVI